MKLPHIRDYRKGDRSRSGLSLLEVVVAITFLVIGLLSLTTTSLAAHVLRRANEEKEMASQAMKASVSDLQAFARAQRDGGAWAPAVTGAYAGGGFDVEGLDPWAGEASCGSVALITDETTTDAEIGVPLGLPRDLNHDGDADDGDVSSSARILPALVRVRWSGVSGQREMVQSVYLSEY